MNRDFIMGMMFALSFVWFIYWISKVDWTAADEVLVPLFDSMTDNIHLMYEDMAEHWYLFLIPFAVLMPLIWYSRREEHKKQCWEAEHLQRYIEAGFDDDE